MDMKRSLLPLSRLKQKSRKGQVYDLKTDAGVVTVFFSVKSKLSRPLQAPTDRSVVLPYFRGHTTFVVEIQQEVFMIKGKSYNRYPAEFKWW